MSYKVAEILDPTHHTSVMTSFRHFITTDAFVDVQFICQGGHKVYAHKLMLISVSRLLKKLIAENPNCNEMITIHLPDVSSKLLKIVVNFLYIGSMRLNYSEMAQFKLLLSLLDIELFQKNQNKEKADCADLDNTDMSQITISDVFYTPNQVTGPQSLNSLSSPVANSLNPSQIISVEYVPIETTAHVDSLSVDASTERYIDVKTDNSDVLNNASNTSFSTVPIQHRNRSIIVQTFSLAEDHQTILSDQNQFCSFGDNVISLANVANDAVSADIVPINSIPTITSQQINFQNASSMELQAGAPQNMIRFVPETQNLTMVSERISFTDPLSESTQPITPVSQISNTEELDSLEISRNTQQQLMDVSSDGMNSQQQSTNESSDNQLPSNLSADNLQSDSNSSNDLQWVTPKAKVKSKGNKRKSSPVIKQSVSSLPDFIDLSEDDGNDYQNPSVTGPTRFKKRKNLNNRGSVVSSSMVSSSSTRR